jgi:hypothetical protein
LIRVCIPKPHTGGLPLPRAGIFDLLALPDGAVLAKDAAHTYFFRRTPPRR